ncbi:amidase signature domain-containing protein [Paraphoma chrysanthemicola]|nr:amidase signature domain-containing protein [Paraphoma chrysanthemicola]
MNSSTWQDRVAEKQKSSFDKIPSAWRLPAAIMDTLQTPLAEKPNRILQMDIPRKSAILTEKELDITEKYSVEQLLKKLRDGEFTALEVTVAFSKRAALAQQLLSCLTETYFPEAQERARFLDSERAQGRVVGPLHGLPISIKDSFHIRGSDSTIGCVAHLGRLSETNSPLVDILVELGAVVYVKTNVPQTMISTDSHNNIFGRTLNPHNTSLNVGGSSGGEAALIAFRGSLLGVGTDMGGSIRTPSLCCGTYGFKPTGSRVPDSGQTGGVLPETAFFTCCAGPLAVDIYAIAIFVRTVFSVRPALYDTAALDIPWRELPSLKTSSKLRLGLLAEDPAFPLHPPVRRALANAVKVLQEQGHEIIPIPAARARVADVTALGWSYFQLAGKAGSAMIAESGEPVIPSILKQAEIGSRLNLDFLADTVGLEGVPKVLALNRKRVAIAEHWRAIWKEEQLDAVVGPAAQNTAVRHDTYGLPPYSIFLNVLDVSPPVQ